MTAKDLSAERFEHLYISVKIRNNQTEWHQNTPYRQSHE